MTPEIKQNSVLERLLHGDHLTVLSALKQCHTTELRKVVCRLKKQGYNIVSYYRDGENFKHYYLKKE